MITKYDEIISDLHKEAYGYRPGPSYFDFWDQLNEAQRDTEVDYLQDVMQENMEREQALARESVRIFEEEVDKTIAYGAGDRKTALRWMTQNEKFYNQQCVEHWVWNLGILFTDEGRALVKELMEIVTFKEWAA